MANSKVNFVRQQGFTEASPEESVHLYPALMWQPRAIGILVLVGVILQAWFYFIALSVLLLWNVAVPQFNLFDAFYNHFAAKPKNLPPLVPAPGPRRFAQFEAGLFMLVIGLSLLFGWHTLAWVVEAILVVALGALIFGRFCTGSYQFLIFTGQRGFANRTLPWSRTE
jgi:hypothetical protein